MAGSFCRVNFTSVKKMFLRWFLRIVVTFVIAILGGWAFENWRGGREWMKAKERAALMGVSLDLADYALEGERRRSHLKWMFPEDAAKK